MASGSTDWMEMSQFTHENYKCICPVTQKSYFQELTLHISARTCEMKYIQGLQSIVHPAASAILLQLKADRLHWPLCYFSNTAGLLF